MTQPRAALLFAFATVEPLHSHAHGVTVALTGYDNETRAPGAQWSKS